MLRRFNRLISVFLIVAVSLYIVILNRAPFRVYLGKETSLETAGGIVLIAVFCFGILCTAIVALYFGMKAWLREQGLLNHEKKRQSFYQTLLEGRSCLAAGDFRKAHGLWQQIVRRDPDNIVAKVELSRCLEGLGQTREALKLIDEARPSAQNNIEILFRSAELNLALGNKTAAIDNLALVLCHHPIGKAAIMARNASEELGRYEDAMEYHERAEDIDGKKKENEEIRLRLEYRKLLRDSSNDLPALKSSLEAFTRANRNYAPALVRLAELRRDAGDLEESAQLMVSAATASHSPVIWRQILNLWVSSGKPDKALAIARAAAKDSTGENRISAELDLIRLYAGLNMIDEARKAIEGVPALAEEQGVALKGDIARRFLTAKALQMAVSGEWQNIQGVLCQLTDGDFEIAGPGLQREGVATQAPSPALATA